MPMAQCFSLFNQKNFRSSVFHFASTSSHFDCAMVCIVLFVQYSSNLPIYTFFDIEIVYLKILLFNFLINLSAGTSFLSLCVSFFRYVFISILLFCKIYFLDLLENVLPLFTHILFGVQLDSFKFFWKALLIVIHF